MITRALETAQERIEGFNFDSRKQILAYDDILNTQRLSIYNRRRLALFGTEEDLFEVVRELSRDYPESEKLFNEKMTEFGRETLALLLRRLLLQVTDMYWLEHLEDMEYLRRSVSLRAYGQRDPLIEYRREGLDRFHALERNIGGALYEAIPHLVLSDDARMRVEEERTHNALVAASGDDTEEEGTTSQQPVKKDTVPNRNDQVTIRNGEETRILKYKKAQQLISEGWELVS